MRLVPGASDNVGGELGLALDQARAGDQIVEYGGSAVLVVESSLSEFFKTTLEVREGPELTLAHVN